MNIPPLQEFFKLESNSTLFELAMKPPSCGGDETFKHLAYIGDNFINKVLQSYFNEMSIIDSGIITKKTKEFHNNRTLVKIGEYLHVSNYMIPIDSNYQISNTDIKEAIESLLGASIQVNGEEIASSIVVTLYLVAEARHFLDVDYISLLNQTLQKDGYINIPWQDERVGGLDHLPEFKTILDINYQGNDYHAESNIFTKKTDSKRDAAKKILQQIGIISEENEDKFDTNKKEQEKSIKAFQSLDDQEIVFNKQEQDSFFEHPMQVSTNTGEKLIDWAMRKAKKDPFSMLILLSGRVENVKASYWYATTPQGELTLLNLNLDNFSFFEIGLGPSKSKSKKNAAEKMVINSKIYDWLDKNFKDEYI